jgi:hypothetical protein
MKIPINPTPQLQHVQFARGQKNFGGILWEFCSQNQPHFVHKPINQLMISHLKHTAAFRRSVQNRALPWQTYIRMGLGGKIQFTHIKLAANEVFAAPAMRCDCEAKTLIAARQANKLETQNWPRTKYSRPL